MKVKTLMNKLKKLNPDADVYVPNNSLYIDGDYLLDSVDTYEGTGDKVYLGANYKKIDKEV